MKMGLRCAGRVWGYYALLLLLGILFVGNLGTGWVSVALNVVLVLLGMLMAYNEGAYSGEKACTLAASLEKQMKEGRLVDEKLRAQVYDRKVAAWILAIGCAPFLLMSAANAIVAPFYPESVVEETQEAELEKKESEGGFQFDYEADEAESQPVNWVNVITRLAFMPFVSVYDLVGSRTLNALFFLFSLPLPAACSVGYWMGPKLRDRKLREIAKGKKRKMRKLKVNQKPRRPKAEV